MKIKSSMSNTRSSSSANSRYKYLNVSARTKESILWLDREEERGGRGGRKGRGEGGREKGGGRKGGKEGEWTEEHTHTHTHTHTHVPVLMSIHLDIFDSCKATVNSSMLIEILNHCLAHIEIVGITRCLHNMER